MSDFPPQEVRLSEVARGCDRMSVHRALGDAEAEHEPEAYEYFARGQMFELYVVRQLEAKYGKGNIERQVIIKHPLGRGHADAYIVPELALVEVKSTSAGTLSTPTYENGVRQLKLYLRFHPFAEVGYLMMLNPSNLRTVEKYEIVLTDDDAEEIDRRIERIQAGIATGSFPDRVCEHPGQARAMLCQFAAPCFDGWEAPDPLVVRTPDALLAVSAFNEIAERRRSLSREIKALDAEYDEAKAAISRYCPTGDSVVGGFTVKRTPVPGRREFKLKAWEAAGGENADLIERFTTKGTGFDKITVKKAAGTADVDWGDSPF